MSTISVLPSLTNELIQFILRICKAIILVVYDDDDLLHLVPAPPDVKNLAIHSRNGTRLLKDFVKRPELHPNVQNSVCLASIEVEEHYTKSTLITNLPIPEPNICSQKTQSTGKYKYRLRFRRTLDHVKRCPLAFSRDFVFCGARQPPRSRSSRRIVFWLKIGGSWEYYMFQERRRRPSSTLFDFCRSRLL
jgi:hypothetical protein